MGEVSATTGSIIELADHLVGEGIERVTLESTSDCWRPFFYLLEAAGLRVQMVNADEVKNAPGRPKTDKLDAVWPAKLTERGMLRPSFVPPAEIRCLRDYTRLRSDLTSEQTRHYSRLEKLLEDALIKVSAVASKLDTLSVRGGHGCPLSSMRGDPSSRARRVTAGQPQPETVAGAWPCRA